MISLPSSSNIHSTLASVLCCKISRIPSRVLHQMRFRPMWKSEPMTSSRGRNPSKVGGSGCQPIASLTIVAGAAAHFMHDIIHDHDDEKASIILRHTAQSMAQTSRLLIAEWVIRDQNAQKTACSTDWIMMLLTSGGMERSLSHWTSLLEGEGLQIVKVWNGQEEGQSVIEAVLGPV